MSICVSKFVKLISRIIHPKLRQNIVANFHIREKNQSEQITHYSYFFFASEACNPVCPFGPACGRALPPHLSAPVPPRDPGELRLAVFRSLLRISFRVSLTDLGGSRRERRTATYTRVSNRASFMCSLHPGPRPSRSASQPEQSGPRQRRPGKARHIHVPHPFSLRHVPASYGRQDKV